MIRKSSLKKVNIIACVGTRPEAIKMAPVILHLKNAPWARLKVVATGQHRRMLDQVLEFFRITPDIDLNLMMPNQTLAQLTARIAHSVDTVLDKEKPDLVLIQGDTTTVFVTALCCFYRRISVGHVEAGLRTHDKWFPYPEEMNRRLSAYLTDLHFAPTRQARQNLLNEDIPAGDISVTGNTVIDALLWVIKQHPVCPVKISKGKRMILVTAHRRESFGAPFAGICSALRDLVLRNPDVEIVYPVHLNPNIRNMAHKLLGGQPRIHLIEPQPYPQFVALMKASYLILSDSGGVQEEAPSLGKPVLVLRDETERLEAIRAGTSRLVGPHRAKIVKEAERLLKDKKAYQSMSHAHNPYGDGHATERIIKAIRKRFVL